MADELVSIIMPSYNTAMYIAESIRSVLAQTYPDWELIIVDDCSTDDTDAVVAPFLSDARIRYLKNDVNSGAAVSRNRALREAKGKWIAFLDSDDLWLPQKLERQLAFMKKNGYVFSYTDYDKIDEDSAPCGVRVSGPSRVTKPGIYRYCWMGCLSVVYKASLLPELQIADIKKNNDYAMWLKLCKRADCYLLGEPLAKYRIRRRSISHDKLSKKLRSHYDLFRVCDERSAPAALWYAGWNMVFGVYKKLKFEKRV